MSVKTIGSLKTKSDYKTKVTSTSKRKKSFESAKIIGISLEGMTHHWWVINLLWVIKWYCRVHLSQDARVISGQGTIGLELINQIEHLDALVIPIGGGGLISGIGTAIKHLNPKIKIIGAEPEPVDDCKRSFDAGQLLVTKKQFTGINTVY